MEEDKKSDDTLDSKRLIALAAVIGALGIGYYFGIALPSQNKAKLDFEKQQYQDQLKQKAASDQAKIDADIFSRQMDCTNLYPKLNQEFNNVAGTYYSSLLNTCMVKYFDFSHDIQETPVDSFQKN